MSTPLRALAFALLSAVAIVLSSGPPAGAAAVAQCTQRWEPAATAAYLTPDGRPTDPPEPLDPPPSAAHRPFHLWCDGHYVTTVWLATPANLREAVRVAYEIVAHAFYPSIHPGVNPGRGLTGLPSWFWAAPDPNPVRMLPGNGPALELELRVSALRWTFGDGSGAANGLGAPYPTPSPVAHVYERTGRYTVAARVTVAGRYWYEELIDDPPPGTHIVTVTHDVAEVRTLLHAS